MLAYVVSLEIWEYGILHLKLIEQNMTEKEHIKNKQKGQMNTTLYLVDVIWILDLFGHPSVAEDRYIIFFSVYSILQMKYCLVSRSLETEPELLACTSSSNAVPRIIFLQLTDVIYGMDSTH